MHEERHFTAEEAAARLGVSKATLYSYVSRGLVRSESADRKTRTRHYNRADVLALTERKAQRRNPARVAAAALDFGSPVLESAITLIEDGHLYYRGMSALELAQRESFEAVAALIWLGDLAALSPELWSAPVPLLLNADAGSRDPLDRFQTLLLPAAEVDLAAYNVEPAAVAQTGVKLLQLLTACITGRASGGAIVAQLQQHWLLERPQAAGLLNAALILCADHELNISSFTARCIASAGSSPYLAVSGALCALRGYRHGGSTQRVELFIAAAAEDPRREVAARLRRGESLPGFDHRLYGAGDPRARLLLEQLTAAAPEHPQVALARQLISLAEEGTGTKPNIDFALVSLARVLALPVAAPLLLFALGRLVGWVGQIGEQYALDQLIRPRARYVGRRPDELGYAPVHGEGGASTA